MAYIKAFRKPKIKKYLTVWFFIIAFLIFPIQVKGQKITNNLQKEMEKRKQNQLISVLILFEGNPAKHVLDEGIMKSSISKIRVNIAQSISDFSARMQRDVLNFLKNTFDKKAKDINSLASANAISAHLTSTVISKLKKFDRIKRISYDPHFPAKQEFDFKLFDKHKNRLISERLSSTTSPDTTWGLKKMNVPKVWQMGLTGKGVLIAQLDGGVSYDHEDIIGQRWDGSGFFYDFGNGEEELVNHGGDFVNDDNDPYNKYGKHGTRVAGVLVGDGDLGKHTGVAPGAKLMMYSISGGGQEPNLEALDFFTHMKNKNSNFPLPDIISSSNSIKFYSSPDWEAFRRATLTNYLYDIIHFNSAGNNGNSANNTDCDDTAPTPIPYEIGVPANTPPPWIGHEDQNSPENTDTIHVGSVMTVGSANKKMYRWSNSSRGPSAWQSIDSTHGRDFTSCQDYSIDTVFHDYIHDGDDVNNSELIKPDVLGPSSYYKNEMNTADSMKSTAQSSASSDYLFFANTSQAQPHVAGVAALMYELNPDLTSTNISKIMQTRSFRPPGKIQEYKDTLRGSGFVNAYEVIKYTLQHYGGILGDSGEIVQLHEEYIIQSDDTLRIADGTTFYVNSGDTLKINGSLIVGQNVTGKFGKGSSLVISEGADIDVNASTANYTVFEGKSSKRWDGLVLKGNDPDIDGLKVHDAKKGIRAKGVKNARISGCELTHNDLGLYIGQDASGTKSDDFEVRNCLIEKIEKDGIRAQGGSSFRTISVTVRASSHYGVYLDNADWKSDSTIVENNDPNANYAGVYLTAGSDVSLEYADGRNRIANNGSHEIYAESEFGSFIAHIPCDEAVPNSIFDSNDDSDDFEYYAVNQDDDQTIHLNNVWWENEDPVSGHFYWYSNGYISRDNPIYQPSDPTGGVGYQASTKQVDYPEVQMAAKGSSSRDRAPRISQHNDFKQLVEGLFTKLREHPNSSQTPHRLNRLYTFIVGLDEFHSLDKRDELREQLATWRERLAKIHDSNKDYPQIRRKVIQEAGETAIVRGMLLAQEENNLSKSARIATTYGDYIKSPRGKRGYQLARTYGHKSRGQYEKALAAADAYRDINIPLPKGISDHAPHVYKRLTHSIELLKAESASGSTSAQKQMTGKNSQTPDTYTLRPNYPNPFNPTTTIRYALPKETHVTVRVYNIMGRRVATLVDSRKEAGRYNVQFNASNLASGVYIYRIQAGSFTKSKKMLLIK